MTIRILIGDARAALRTLDGESVDCCITSPPYFGLRDYGVDGQIGREPTVGEYVGALVEVMREVRRVLRPEGTVFLNLGDSYKASSKSGAATRPRKDLEGKWKGGIQSRNGGSYGAPANPYPVDAPLKPKDLMLVPARVAIALQEDGWWVRSEIIWGKPNPMPESVTSRPSKAHEHIWMLTKSGRHYYNNGEGQVAEAALTTKQREVDRRSILAGKTRPYKYGRNPGYDALREQAARPSIADTTADRARNDVYTFGRKANPDRKDGGNPYKPKTVGPNGYARRGREPRDGARLPVAPSTKGKAELHARLTDEERAARADPSPKDYRTVSGAVASQADRLAGAVKQARMGRRLRNYEDAPLEVWRFSPAQFKDAHFATFPPTLVERCLAIGCPEGGTVLDPFGGAGTTGLVADQLGYDAILCELNEAYADLSVSRIEASAPLTAQVTKEVVQAGLFEEEA